MAAMKIMRLVLIGSVLTMLVQATLGCAQIGMAILLRSKNLCPRWLVAASALLMIAEVAEFAMGHLHYVMVHVPLGVGIFGGAVRQLVWSVTKREEGGESRA